MALEIIYLSYSFLQIGGLRSKCLTSISLFPFFFNVNLFLIECMQGRGRKRGTEDPSGLRVGSNEPDVGLKLTNHEIMTGAEVGCSTDQTPRVPLYLLIFFLQDTVWLMV